MLTVTLLALNQAPGEPHVGVRMPQPRAETQGSKDGATAGYPKSHYRYRALLASAALRVELFRRSDDPRMQEVCGIPTDHAIGVVMTI